MVEQETPTAPRAPEVGEGGGAGAAPIRFRADIQGLRAVAVTAVVLFHAGMGFSGGFVGVDVFFVISGFVITGMLRTEQHRAGAISLRGFYLRRIRRLLPALAVLLVAVVALAPLLGPMNGGATTSSMASAGALFSANARLVLTSQGYFDARAEANPLLHLWTLSVEEQVYLVVPLLFIGAWKVGRSRWPWERVVGVAVGVAAIASFALAVVLVGGYLPGPDGRMARVAFYSSPTRAWEFLVGSLLALGAPTLGRGARAAAGALGAMALLVCFVTFDARTAFPWVAAGVPVAAAALLLVAGIAGGNPISAGLSTRPARWVGDRSYSWYLWHWPLIVFARSLFPGVGWAPPLAAMFSLVPACLSYALLENPIRHRRAVKTTATLALGAACVLAPLLLTRGEAALDRRLERVSSVRDLRSAMRSHADVGPRRCNESLADPGTAEGCTWSISAPSGRALLIGDSNAGHLSEVFVASANGLGLDATIQTRAACPFVDLVVRRGRVVDERCRAFYERQLAAIVADPPSVVVIGGAGDLLMAKDEIELAATATGPYAQSEDDQLEVWQLGMDRTLDVLGRAGVGVVVVHPVPRFTGWQSPGECARLRVMVDPQGCGTERATPAPGPITAVEERAIRFHATTVGLELGPFLCPGSRCGTTSGDTWIWKDESHLSVDGALSVQPQLTAAMASAQAAAADEREREH